MQEDSPESLQPRAQPPAGSVAQQPGEQIYFQGRAKHSAKFGTYLLWFFVCVLGGALAYGLNQIDVIRELEWPLWVLSLLGTPMLGVTYLRHITTKYKVSPKRIETEKGILMKNVDSLELWRVLDVRYEQSILDRIFGIAKIQLIGTDQTDSTLEMHGLPGHRELFESLRDA
ncbi:MAG: PH domain-containing protein, partial [Nannocystaceae bacterium]